MEHERLINRPLTRWIPWIALVAVVLTACAPDDASPPPAPTTAPPDTPIIIVSIDTLRADRLPAYGYDGVETPHIDRLRRDGILYENAYSHIPLTLPSHASLLSGLLPPEHGIRDNIGYTLDADRVASGEIPHLPRLLKAEGYATGAAVSSFVLRGKMGLDLDFDFYEDAIEFRPGIGLGGMQRAGVETLGLTVEWLRTVAEGPFFLLFHMYEPHSPYTPPEPFRSRYPDNPYDGEVATSDQVVGDLLGELDRLGIYDDALIILLSDHGEGLGDHGEDEHGVLLYRTTLQVPLILKLPGNARAGEAAAEPVQLIDVLPTITQLLDLETPEGRGDSLLDVLDGRVGERQIYSETFYPRLHFGWSDLASLIDATHHYIEGPDPELFDLTVDPDELDNVLREQRRTYTALRDQLATFDRTLAAPAEVDEESRAALAALGYIGSTPADLEGPLPDPKSRLDTLADLQAAFRFHSQKKDEEAVAAFQRALVENPRMLDAWEFMARSLQRLGRREESLEAYQKALELSGGAGHLAVSAASLFFELEQFDDAIDHARLALDSHPSFAHGLLARIALRRKDLDTAEAEARRALEEGPRFGPRVTLASVHHARGQYADALAMVTEIERDFQARESQDTDLIQGLHLLMGKIHADQGNAAAAEAAFRREIELFPTELPAHTGLAVLYALSGRPQEVTGVLRGMVEANPTDFAYAEAVKTLRVLGFDPGARALLGHARGLFPESRVLAELSDQSAL